MERVVGRDASEVVAMHYSATPRGSIYTAAVPRDTCVRERSSPPPVVVLLLAGQVAAAEQQQQDVVADVRRRAPHVRDRGPPPHLRRHHRPRRHRLGPEHRIPAVQA